jgi:hypothetical protein
VNYAFASPSNPGANGGNIIYAISSDIHSISGFPPNPHAITSFNANGLPTAGSASIVILGDGHGNLPTIYLQHYSLEADYQFSKQLVASVTYQGSVGRHLIQHMTPNSGAVVAGYTLNTLVPNGGGDWWINSGVSSNNAMLLEVKHPIAHHFTADAQFQWAKSMDTNGSGPYYEDPYFPEYSGYSYGPSDFNVGKSFKAFGVWQPVIFHGDSAWLEKIVGGWSIAPIFQWHTGFPYSAIYGTGQSLYCNNCGYFNIRPSNPVKGGSDHSNHAFINGTNYAGITSATLTQTATVNGSVTVVQYSNKYFATGNFRNAMQAASGTGFPSPNIALPGAPGIGRNAFVGPSYHNFDLSITKAFGIPNTRLLGENARFEIRADMFNLFNLLNLNPTSVTNNIAASSGGAVPNYFGADQTALGGRTISFQMRFSF